MPNHISVVGLGDAQLDLAEKIQSIDHLVQRNVVGERIDD